MSDERIQKIIKVMEAVAEDMANDAKEFEGKPFNGKTVATYFGNQGAAIAAVANAVKEILTSQSLDKERST